MDMNLCRVFQVQRCWLWIDMNLCGVFQVLRDAGSGGELHVPAAAAGGRVRDDNGSRRQASRLRRHPPLAPRLLREVRQGHADPGTAGNQMGVFLTKNITTIHLVHNWFTKSGSFSSRDRSQGDVFLDVESWHKMHFPAIFEPLSKKQKQTLLFWNTGMNSEKENSWTKSFVATFLRNCCANTRYDPKAAV